MRLEEYWGVGPKTAATLRESLGEEAAVAAIESADVRALVDAGLSGGRAVRILRRADGGGGMDLFATGDARDVYDRLLDIAARYAVTAHAADRVRVLTPLTSERERERRLERVLEARDAWVGLAEDARETVLEAFERYDEAGGTDRAALECALALREAGLHGGTFAALEDVDAAALREAADALGALDADGVAHGADERLDRLRERAARARELADSAFDVVERVRESGARDADAFQAAVVEYVAGETDLARGRVESAAPDGAVDSADFVGSTLRTLADELEAEVESREREVREALEADVEGGGADVQEVVDAVGTIAFRLSLGRFAADRGLVRPVRGGDGIAVRDARNLFLSGEVQPVTYAVGEHSLDVTAPDDDRVAVLTGANSGGKTTLLETLCQVVVLASMGLPVPAAAAEVGPFDRVVFHRRHASFNAGVLESTLKSVVPPLVESGRTLMLVDEFEAITEPGRAADLLNGLVELTVDRGAVGAYVTHLAEDLSPLPEAARIDGIFAEGLTDDLELLVDYQPRFGVVGRSTPEFIVSRLVANARDRGVRQAFEELAGAVGEEAVQRTLSDAEWSADTSS